MTRNMSFFRRACPELVEGAMLSVDDSFHVPQFPIS
jgi:hypothetical protein